MTSVNIVLGNHVTNIGNAFLDLGSKASIRAASPDAHIFQTSSFPRWFEHTQVENRGLFRRSDPDFYSLVYRAPADFAAFAGMIVTKGFIDRYGPIIRRMRDRGVRIILNGAGPVRYDERETEICREFWSEVGLFALVSRDQFTFDTYGDIAENPFNGIDCGFFLSDGFTPEKLDSPEYDALAFDSIKEPDGLDSGSRMVVRPHHKMYPNVVIKDPGALGKPNVFLSELATDYLNIYGNAREVHTDRVHACVASVSYDVPCRLYSDSKRGFLFEKLGVSLEEMQSGMISIDRDLLNKAKQVQIEFLKGLLNSA